MTCAPRRARTRDRPRGRRSRLADVGRVRRRGGDGAGRRGRPGSPRRQTRLRRLPGPPRVPTDGCRVGRAGRGVGRPDPRRALPPRRQRRAAPGGTAVCAVRAALRARRIGRAAVRRLPAPASDSTDCGTAHGDQRATEGRALVSADRRRPRPGPGSGACRVPPVGPALPLGDPTPDRPAGALRYRVRPAPSPTPRRTRLRRLPCRRPSRERRAPPAPCPIVVRRPRPHPATAGGNP